MASNCPNSYTSLLRSPAKVVCATRDVMRHQESAFLGDVHRIEAVLDTPCFPVHMPHDAAHDDGGALFNVESLSYIDSGRIDAHVKRGARFPALLPYLRVVGVGPPVIRPVRRLRP